MHVRETKRTDVSTHNKEKNTYVHLRSMTNLHIDIVNVHTALHRKTPQYHHHIELSPFPLVCIPMGQEEQLLFIRPVDRPCDIARVIRWRGLRARDRHVGRNITVAHVVDKKGIETWFSDENYEAVQKRSPQDRWLEEKVALTSTEDVYPRRSH